MHRTKRTLKMRNKRTRRQRGGYTYKSSKNDSGETVTYVTSSIVNARGYKRKNASLKHKSRK